MSLDMEKYIKVRKAQAEGVRTVEELKEKSDIVIDNDTEIQEIEKIITVPQTKCIYKRSGERS